MINIKNHEQGIIITALVIINFIVKVIFLPNNSLGGDEPFSVYIAQMDLPSIIRLLSEGNNPPLYEILLHFWIKIFGISEFSVRFPSLLFSCITVLFIYRTGIKFLNKRIALYSAVIFIFSNYHIFFAHESRVYSLLGMFTAISMYIFMGILQDNKETLNRDNDSSSKSNITKKFVLLTLVNTLIIYSHYFGFFVLFVQFLYLIIYLPLLRKYWKQVLLYVGAIVILYLPNILVLTRRFIESSGGTWVSPPEGLVSIYNMLWTFSNAPVVTVCVITILLAAFIKFLFSKKTEFVNANYFFIVFWFLSIFFFMFAISFWIPMFLNRYLMAAAIAFVLLLGICMDYVISNSRYRYVIPAIICILFIASAKPNLTNKRNVRETVEKIKQLKDSNTLVIICPYNFVLDFTYYYNPEYFRDYNTEDMYANASNHLKQENIFGVNNINDIDLKSHNRVVFLDAGANFSSPDNSIKDQLNVKYLLKNSYKIYEIYDIYEYELK